MVPIKLLFEANITIVYFFYGLSFFSLGLVIALRSRQHSRLELGRSLGWVAAFGFAHGFHEWGDIFIPIQNAYMHASLILFLRSLQVFLLALSFAFLFQFGAEMNRTKWPKIMSLPLILITAWTLWFFIVPGSKNYEDLSIWLLDASIWARYLIGFPAGIVAALGLKYQAEKIFEQLKNQRIFNTFRVAGVMLVGYAILSGLLVSSAQYFPANILNTDLLSDWSGIPVPVFRSIISILLSISIIRALDIFDLEITDILNKYEIESILTREKENIGRQLHDQTIQTIYVAGLLVDSVKRGSQIVAADEKKLDRALGSMDDAIASLRKSIGELQPKDHDETILKLIRSRLDDSNFSSLFTLNLDIQIDENEKFGPNRSHHLIEILGESLANIARHAHAKTVSLKVFKEEKNIVFIITDDGLGFSIDSSPPGFGLRNMRDRARLMGGNLYIETAPNQGTEIWCTVPLEDVI